MISLETVTQFMLENFEQVQISGNRTHFLSRCLLCGDSKKSLYKKRFNLDWNNGLPIWHCWNCGRKGNFIKIYSIVKGISYDDAKKELFSLKSSVKFLKRRRKSFSINKKKKKEKEFLNWIKNESYDLNSEEGRYKEALKKFYRERKIDEKYILYICNEGRYRNRIIIPIFDEKNNIIYFQARRIPNTNIEPKYDNPSMPKELIIFNKHMFNRNKSIIITEGLIDAFMIGDQGTSCLGKEVSEEFINKLFEYTDKDVIIALDNDQEAYKSLARFFKNNKYSKKVKYFLYPKEYSKCKDINNIVESNDFNLDIYELITQNSVSYSTAYTRLSILKMLEGNTDENNKDRKRFNKYKRKKL